MVRYLKRFMTSQSDELIALDSLNEGQGSE